MESSPLIRRVTFGLIVLVLAGLGAYLVGPVAHGSSSPPPRRPVTTPAVTPTPTSAASPQPSSQAPAGAPDIYQWLPFTAGALAAAASVAQRFGDAAITTIQGRQRGEGGKFSRRHTCAIRQ